MTADGDAGLAKIGVDEFEAFHTFEECGVRSAECGIGSALFHFAFRIPHSGFEKFAFRLYRQLRLPQRFAAMDRIVKIQSTRHAESADLAFIYVGNAIDEIGDAGIPIMLLFLFYSLSD